VATLSQLVERLTHHQFNDLDYANAFLLIYRYFTTQSKNLLDALIKRFNISSRKKSDKAASEDQENITQLVQISVDSKVFSRWIKSRVSSYDFDDPDSALNKEAFQFLQDLKKNPNCIYKN